MNDPFQWRRIIAIGIAMAGVGLLATAGIFFNASYAGKSTGSAESIGIICFGHVDVEGGILHLTPMAPGKVAKVEVKEGQLVAQGTVLLRLDDTTANLKAEEAEAALRVVQAQLDEARNRPAQHEAKVKQQRAALAAAAYRLSASRHQLERKRQMKKIGQINDQEYSVAMDLVRELESAEEAEKNRLKELELTDPESTVRRLKGEVAVASARLALARRALEDCHLRAPLPGKVLRFQVAIGDLIGKQTANPSVLFCPNKPRMVRAEVSQEFAGKLRVGASCQIYDDYGSNDKSWQGKVERISDWYTRQRSILPDPGERFDVRTLECIVRLKPNQAPLRIGQRMRLVVKP